MRVSLSEAYRLLHSGHVVAVPTETVYGLAAGLERPGAIDQIFSLKKRPANNPLIIHAADVSQISPFLAAYPEDFALLARNFWPGPLTLILEANQKVPPQVRAGLPTAAFRIPQHSLTRALLEWIGPLVMPSANLSGKPSATKIEHVEHDFGEKFPVLDGGACGCGLESTILIFREGAWQIARQGALPPDAFYSTLGYLPNIISQSSQEPICPGQKYKHYAPETHLILSKQASQCSTVVLGYNDRNYPLAKKIYFLGQTSRPDQVAEKLYATLRELDRDSIQEATVDVDVPDIGLWKTILERLSKASDRSG